MAEFLSVSLEHPRRAECESFVRHIYALTFGATLSALPKRMIALLDAEGRLACAAGLRHAPEHFFSECYLPSPVEQVLSGLAGRAVPRGAVLEITTLASRSPAGLPALIDGVTELGEGEGFEWAFFTLTRRLARLVQRLRPDVIGLGPAARDLAPDPEIWGNYYEAEPSVFALGRRDVCAPFIGGGKPEAVHASVL